MLVYLHREMEKYGFSMNFDNLESNIDGAVKIICYLLDCAVASNFNNWSLGRYGLKKISENSPNLLMNFIEPCIEKIIDMNDTSEYETVETIIMYCIPSFFPQFVAQGLNSKNEEIIMIATECINKSYEEYILDFYKSKLYETIKKEYFHWENEIKTRYLS